MESTNLVKQVVDAAGGQTALARRLCRKNPKLKAQHIQKWLRSGRVPPLYCKEIELLFGNRYSAERLRPDIFGPPPTSQPAPAASREVAA